MMSAQNISGITPANVAQQNEAAIFGIPIGRLGLISRLMIGGASGLIVFFIAFVLAIVGVSIYDSVAGISITNLNIAYLYIAAPIGILATLASLTYLIVGWTRQKFSGVE
mgnify:CR=1 FL=1